MFQGSSTKARPTSASATEIHCRPLMRSCSTGQAKISTQNGMVNTRTEVLPGPPSDNAQVLSNRKAPVWIRPIHNRACQCWGRIELRVQMMATSNVRMPRPVRNATTSTGLA